MHSAFPVSVPHVPRKSPGIAWLISLFVPGSGQIYCGKSLRGISTLVFSLLMAGGCLFLNPNSQWWGVSLRALIVLYGFSFLDAYYTAREFNSGKDPAPYQNPRVAAVLNLLTNGFGYFYLGQRAKGLIVFVGMRVLGGLLAGIPWVWELILMAISVDAYRIGRLELSGRRRAPLLASSGVLQLGLSEDRPQEAPESLAAPPLPVEAGGLKPIIPIALACVLAVAYWGLVLIATIMPDYRILDQSRASVNQTAEEIVYSNPKYGVEMHIPVSWSLGPQHRNLLIQAMSPDTTCRAGLALESISPLSSLASMKEAVIQRSLDQNPNFRMVGQRVAKLGVRSGYEVTFTFDLDGAEYLMRYVLVRKGMTVYSLVLTNPATLDDACRRVTDIIRLRLVLPVD